MLKTIRDKLVGNELELSMMSLKEVPVKEIALIPRVASLDLSSNLLKSLPHNFGAQLSHIVKLDLSANKLTALPKTFHLLIELRHLDLYNNQITDLPVSLNQLTKLKFLDIKNNPLNSAIQSVVGDCLTRKECENAAKKLVSYCTKQKQLAIDQEIMANKAKEARDQQQREAAEEIRKLNERKAAKKDRKNENKMVKLQQQHQQVENQKRQANAASNNKKANGTVKSSKKPNKKKSGSSCMSWINMLLVLCTIGATAWCVHLHVDGDYSKAGLQAAVPRFQNTLSTLKNITVEALQPQNLRSTWQTVCKNVNSSAYEAAAVTKKAAYASQEYIEVYTGDLTPYTSKVSAASCVAYEFTKAKCSVAYDWLLAQDWQGMWNTVITFLAMVWKNIQDLWSAALKNPTVAAIWNSICMYTSSALVWLQQFFYDAFLYLQKNGPVWLELARDKTYNTIYFVQERIQLLLK